MSTTISLSAIALLTHNWPRAMAHGSTRPLLSSLVALVIICIAQVNLVATNSINGSSSTLTGAPPSLSERSGSLNSRYLSAGSTASLAAATVAAAANQQTSASNGGTNAQTNSGAGSQAAVLHQSQHQHPHQHQQHNIQQQQQQQPQQQQAVINQHSAAQPTPVQQQHVAANNLAQYSPITQQPVQTNNPPIMTSTFTYNPLAGQYLGNPSDLGQLAPGGGQGIANNFPSLQQQQQQQQPAQYQFQVAAPGSQFGTGFSTQQNPLASYQTFSNSPSRQRPPFSFPFGFASSLSGGQQQLPMRYQTAFTRRNGLSSLRPQNNYLAGGSDDESGGGGFSFQQQQQQQAGATLADQLAASLGFNLDPSYSSSLPSPSNVYLQQQQNGNQAFDLSQPASSPSSSSSSSLGLAQGHHHLANSGQHQNLFVSNGAAGGQLAPLASEHQRGDQQCIAADGRHGTCYQASECIRRGGTPMGRCANTLGGLADQTGPSSSVCCLFDVTCGQFAAERFVYFRNPGYPTNSYDQSRMCRAKIGKLDKGVCQFRLDMLRFDIAKPTNGNCSQDMFVVSGQNENYVIPKICGFNDGQHYYVGVDESGVITLHMMMMGYYRRSFEILITQIPCRSDFGAPAHCLQYFVGTHGTIKSFNYDDDYASAQTPPFGSGGGNSLNGNNNQAFVSYDLQQDGSSTVSGGGISVPPATAPYGLQILHRQQQQQLFTAPQLQGPSSNRFAQLNEFNTGYQFGGYPNDLDYTICIRKESGFCSVSYQLSRTGDQGTLAPFAIGQTTPFGGQNESNAGGWHSVSSDCHDDYLLIGGVRLCSGQPTNPYDSPYAQQQQHHLFQNNSSFGVGYLQQQQQQQQMLLQQQQQLQNQQNLLMQQLARLQQQQASGNSSANAVNSNSLQQQQQNQAAIGGNVNSNGQANNLEQQQAAVVQQLMLVQQQLGSLAASAGSFASQQQQQQQQQQFNGFQTDLGQNVGELHGSIITDTTSGPFLLRFVSNNARNARGFHIDYRQNPCK